MLSAAEVEAVVVQVGSKMCHVAQGYRVYDTWHV